MIRTDLGPVTAYAYAKQKGYSGTEEEFAEDIAALEDNASKLNALYPADPTLSVPEKAADAAAVGELKEDLDVSFGSIVAKLKLISGPNLCVGDWSMKPGFVSTAGVISASDDYVYSKMIKVNEGDIIGICVNIDGTFARRQLRFITAYNENKVVLASSGAQQRNSYTVPSGVAYVRLSTVHGSNYYIYKNTLPSEYEPYNNYYVVTNEFLPQKVHYEKYEGSLASGGQLALTTRSAIKDGEEIVFKGYLTSFSAIRMAFYTNAVTNYIDVDGTSIVVANKDGSSVVKTHELTIANYISLCVVLNNGVATITLQSGDENTYSFSCEWEQIGGSVSSVQVISTGTACSSATLLVNYSACLRGVWIFGDSYVSFNSYARWAYWLKDAGYAKNVLISGASGGKSAISNVALSGLLNYGTPKFAVFATGINDGTDSASAPNETWATQRDLFIATCEANDIEPIFATIPTVPNINNEKKNTWVKSSGYRYIDFAKAVGANASGVWYTGMLNVDGVHPTEAGAKALYSQVLIDLPEVMVESGN